MNNIDLINSYFPNIIFTKVQQKEQYIIYAASIAASLGDGSKHYVLVFVPVHLAIKNKAKIEDLTWVNIQTRTIKNGYKLPQQKWDLPFNNSDLFFNVIDRMDTYSKYISQDGNFELLLINDPKKKTKYQYYNKMSLSGALSTFSCVLNYLGNSMKEESRMLYSQPPIHSETNINYNYQNNEDYELIK